MRAALVSLALACAGPTPIRTQPVVVRAELAGHAVWLEVAATDAARERGLSGRRALGDDEGMAFVWPAEAPRSFWMRGTDLPLDIGFFRADGTLASVVTMAPNDLSPHDSGFPASLAVELPAGWFAAHTVTPGAHIYLPLPDGLPLQP